MSYRSTRPIRSVAHRRVPAPSRRHRAASHSTRFRVARFGELIHSSSGFPTIHSSSSGSSFSFSFSFFFSFSSSSSCFVSPPLPSFLPPPFPPFGSLSLGRVTPMLAGGSGGNVAITGGGCTAAAAAVAGMGGNVAITGGGGGAGISCADAVGTVVVVTSTGGMSMGTLKLPLILRLSSPLRLGSKLLLLRLRSSGGLTWLTTTHSEAGTFTSGGMYSSSDSLSCSSIFDTVARARKKKRGRLKKKKPQLIVVKPESCADTTPFKSGWLVPRSCVCAVQCCSVRFTNTSHQNTSQASLCIIVWGCMCVWVWT